MIDGLIPITDEQAKLAQEIVKTFRGLGSFLERALGSTPEDLVGYFGGDRLRVRRAENMARMMYEAQKRLAARGVDETKPATLSVALPILQGAADEDREELVDLWARLLANAMDPSMNTVRHSFIEAVKKMDRMDAVVLRYIHGSNMTVVRRGRAPEPIVNQTTGVENIAIEIGRRNDEVEVSLRHLEDLLFFDQMPGNPGVYVVNPTTREFMRACYPEVETE
jgi:hypothetical protein